MPNDMHASEASKQKQLIEKLLTEASLRPEDARCEIGGAFNVVELKGLSRYRNVWQLQQAVNLAVKNGELSDTLLFVEHYPVYTLGFHGNAGNMALTQQQLELHNVELIRIERGGDITFHGPGQLVVYLIVDLGKSGAGIKRFVEQIEHAVIDTLDYFGVESHRREEAPGVWVTYTSGERKKICALGLKVKNGVTMHGLALNLSTDLKWFRYINPCGFQPGSVTSLREVTGNENTRMHDVVRMMRSKLTDRLFGIDR